METHPSNATSTPSACPRWPSHAEVNPVPFAANSNTGEPSATKSNGGPDPKDGSTTSNAATAGTAPNTPASRAPEPGAATASSLTTWSRSVPSQHDTGTTARTSHTRHHHAHAITDLAGFQVEVASAEIPSSPLPGIFGRCVGAAAW